jgi:hypothetical protein
MSRGVTSDEINLLTKFLSSTLYGFDLQVPKSEFAICNSHILISIALTKLYVLGQETKM